MVRKPTQRRILVLGCSYAMGQGVPDKETFCWKLNDYYHDRTFENFAVDGYGTYHSYLLEKRLLEQHDKGWYDLVMYCPIQCYVLRNFTYCMWNFASDLNTSQKVDRNVEQIFLNNAALM